MPIFRPGSGTALHRALQAEGFDLPANCGDVELEMPVDGVMILRYRIILDDMQLEKLARALSRIAKREF